MSAGNPRPVPLVSVITPARNAAATAHRAFASLAAQSFGAWEHIFVDDGSEDATAALARAEAAREPRSRVLTQAPQGAAAARNRGVREARGEWLAFLDADDAWPPGHLEALMKLTGDPRIDAVVCGVRTFLPGGETLAPRPAPRRSVMAFPDITSRPPIVIHAIVLRRRLFLDVGGFDEALRTNEDWDLWARLARSGVLVASTDATLVDYRRSHGSLTRDSAAMIADAATVLKRLSEPDARVARPAPGLENGFDAVDRAGGTLGCAVWCLGADIGAGVDVGPALAALPADLDYASAPVAGLHHALLEGLAIGASKPFGRLVEIWPGIAAPLEAALTALERRVARAGLADLLARGVERDVIRAADAPRTRLVGRSFAVRLTPRTLLRPPPRPDGAATTIFRAPGLRPRSWALFETTKVAPGPMDVLGLALKTTLRRIGRKA